MQRLPLYPFPCFFVGNPFGKWHEFEMSRDLPDFELTFFQPFDESLPHRFWDVEI